MGSFYSWVVEQKASALIGSKEVALGVCLALKDYAVDFDRLFRFGWICEAGANGVRRCLTDRQNQLVGVFNVFGCGNRVVGCQDDLVGDGEGQVAPIRRDLPTGQGQERLVDRNEYSAGHRARRIIRRFLGGTVGATKCRGQNDNTNKAPGTGTNGQNLTKNGCWPRNLAAEFAECRAKAALATQAPEVHSLFHYNL